MRVSDSVRSCFRKHVNCLLDVEAASVDKIANDEIAGTIEAIVTVNTDHVIFPVKFLSSCLLIFSHSINLKRKVSSMEFHYFDCTSTRS